MTIIFVAELEAFQLTQMFEVFVEERENPQKAQTVMEGELLNHSYTMLLTNLTLCLGMFEKRLAEMKERSQDIELWVCVCVCHIARYLTVCWSNADAIQIMTHAHNTHYFTCPGSSSLVIESSVTRSIWQNDS